MTSDVLQQVDAFVTPGTMLRSAREAKGLSSREVEDQLNLMPGYVDILERDDYSALRSPAFARGYVRAYGLLMAIDEAELLRAFDEQRACKVEDTKRVETRPLQLQRTGTGVIVGLAVLLLLFVGLWFWQGRGDHTETKTSLTNPALEQPGQTPEGEL